MWENSILSIELLLKIHIFEALLFYKGLKQVCKQKYQKKGRTYFDHQ